jgi:hypothetical protein
MRGVLLPHLDAFMALMENSSIPLSILDSFSLRITKASPEMDGFPFSSLLYNKQD